MVKSLKMTLVAAAALGGVAMASGSASAMPMAGLDKSAATVAGKVENVRWVCGPFRCFYRPGFYGGYGGYGWRGYGWRGGYGYGWRRRWW